MKDRQADEAVNRVFAHVKIENDGGHLLSGTKVYVGDTEIHKELTNVEFRHKAGELAELTCHILAAGGYQIQLPAAVKVQFTVLPEHELLVRDLGDGQISYVSRAWEGDE